MRLQVKHSLGHPTFIQGRSVHPFWRPARYFAFASIFLGVELAEAVAGPAATPTSFNKSTTATVYARNLKRYGDKLGPSIEWLRNAGKSWEDIIESATRAGGKDLGS